MKGTYVVDLLNPTFEYATEREAFASYKDDCTRRAVPLNITDANAWLQEWKDCERSHQIAGVIAANRSQPTP
jgi:hypothetical protein